MSPSFFTAVKAQDRIDAVLRFFAPISVELFRKSGMIMMISPKFDTGCLRSGLADLGVQQRKER